MVGGPPCRQCGNPLRWFAEQNAWGCDRCRQMFPAQPLPPQSLPAQARPGSGKKLAIGALVLIGGIVAIAVLAGGGKSKDSGATGGGDRIARDEAAWTKFRDEICACHDRGCAQQIHDEEDKYVAAHEGEPDVPPSPKLKALFLEAGRCFQAAVTGAAAKPSEEDESIDDDVMTQELGNLRDRMCACRDKACAGEVADGLQDWGKQYKARFDSRPADVRRQALAIVAAANKCYDKITGK